MTFPDLRMRPATAADAPAVSALVNRAYAPWIQVIGREPLPMTVDYAAALERRRFDLLASGERVVALVETEVREDDLLILNLAVDPDLHGRGLGRRLLGHADGLAAPAGRDVLRLYTHELYARNIRIYERHGYAIERLEPFRGAAAVHMIRRLSQARPPRDLRLCVFGDSFTNGTGDDEALGWVGRVAARARRNGADLTVYNLGVRRETSSGLRARWREEARRRLPAAGDGRLMFAFGINDPIQQVAPETTEENLRAIFGEALALAPVLAVGPLAVTGEAALDDAIAALSGRLKTASAELGAPYFDAVETARALQPAWRKEAQAGDGVHPNAASYAALAEAIWAWPAWRAWLGATPPRS